MSAIAKIIVSVGDDQLRIFHNDLLILRAGIHPWDVSQTHTLLVADGKVLLPIESVTNGKETPIDEITLVASDKMPDIRFRRLRATCLAYGVGLERGDVAGSAMLIVQFKDNNAIRPNKALAAAISIHRGLELLEELEAGR